MYDALVGYRNADPYPRQSRAMVEALDDADDLRSQVPALKAYISVLESLAKQVRTASAEDAIASFQVGADRVVDDCDDCREPNPQQGRSARAGGPQ